MKCVHIQHRSPFIDYCHISIKPMNHTILAPIVFLHSPKAALESVHRKVNLVDYLSQFDSVAHFYQWYRKSWVENATKPWNQIHQEFSSTKKSYTIHVYYLLCCATFMRFNKNWKVVINSCYYTKQNKANFRKSLHYFTFAYGSSSIKGEWRSIQLHKFH